MSIYLKHIKIYIFLCNSILHNFQMNEKRNPCEQWRGKMPSFLSSVKNLLYYVIRRTATKSMLFFEITDAQPLL